MSPRIEALVSKLSTDGRSVMSAWASCMIDWRLAPNAIAARHCEAEIRASMWRRLAQDFTPQRFETAMREFEPIWDEIVAAYKRTAP